MVFYDPFLKMHAWKVNSHCLLSVYILFCGDFCVYNTLYDYVRMKIASNIDVCQETSTL